MPQAMDEIARQVWRRVMREMGAAGVITGADLDILRCYCEAVSRYVEAQQLYAQASPLLKDRGHLVKNPLHQIVRDSADQVRLLARELGLSPAARANLQLTIGHEAPDIDADIGLPPRLRVLAGSA
jgi:P27 family predicted phage terminase small subunit